MAFSPAEARYLASEGFDDVLVAYPTALALDAAHVAAANASGATVSLAVDAVEHLDAAERAAKHAGTRIPIVIDIDTAYRPVGKRIVVGVKRSPLSTPEATADLAQRVLERPSLRLEGLLAYEAHVAGVADDSRGGRVMDAAKRAMKRLAVKQIADRRRAIRDELARRNIEITLFNGGGTGSISTSSEDDALTEVTAGSGFLCSHLFDGYRGLSLEPAAFFALQVTRRPGSNLVTCQSGGFVASGASGRDRSPLPWLPFGLELTDLEGAGEVQTPLSVPDGTNLGLGDPVFFRHAKAGELAEHLTEYLLIRGDRIESRAPTYRGAGKCF